MKKVNSIKFVLGNTISECLTMKITFYPESKNKNVKPEKALKDRCHFFGEGCVTYMYNLLTDVLGPSVI